MSPKGEKASLKTISSTFIDAGNPIHKTSLSVGSKLLSLVLNLSGIGGSGLRRRPLESFPNEEPLNAECRSSLFRECSSPWEAEEDLSCDREEKEARNY